ncbi:MAG: ZIP family metal transporter [Acidobacteria bacterium]|nr:ZIP family metal transporter [Acidobacteriota bacterium]
MSVLWIAIALSAIGSLLGALVASSVLIVSDAVRAKVVKWLVSFAVGTLLGAALLKLVPEALETLSPTATLGTLLAGIFTFFILEKLVIWRHCHEAESCEVHGTSAPLVLVGDAVHTFVDGAIIAAATITSIPLGVSAAVAAIAHEIPQEAGDVAILLHAGYSRRRALVLNLLSGTSGIVGAVAVYFFAARLPGALPFVLAFAAGSFLYVAMADLIPDLHRGQVDRNPVRQVVLIAAGVATLALL